MSDKKYQKIRPMTKQDKQQIIKNLDRSLNHDSDEFSGPGTWIDDLKQIDQASFARSLAQILNGTFDSLPQDIIDASPDLQKISKSTPITIMHVLSCTDTLFRFAPSPSGHLHIGHFVPVLLNILLRNFARISGKSSDIVLRIDDTNPDEDDFSSDITATLKRLMGQGYDDLIMTRSSKLASRVVDMIDQSIMRGGDKFYVDLTDQTIMQKERTDRTENLYRHMDQNTQQVLWRDMKQGKHPDAVVRAKIDMKSDNGNLRDPVMLRFVTNLDAKQSTDTKTPLVLMPTYDLICPVLDSLDASTNNRTLIALRDCNYYDRLDQYNWIQSALMLKPTAVVTFSRVNFENILLSKRKIKKLILSGKISSWDDPRLMTINGIFNRGMTMMGLLNFYWLSGHMSLGNRATSQHVDTLFSANDKILSQRSNFIIDRMPVSFDVGSLPDAEKDLFMIISIKACVPRIQNGEKGDILFSDSQNTNNSRYEDSLDNMVPDLVSVRDVFCKMGRLVSCNLKYINDLSASKEVKLDLDDGATIIADNNLGKDKFKLISDVKIGDTIKINNFKDQDLDPDFGGYYYVVSKDLHCFTSDNCDHIFNRLNVIHII